tara:strand:- start:694 stop:1029 length:336 start_codon:yes stop_codon:yes gene_type:complete
MATLIATATLQINSFFGNPYVSNDYVASNYVEGNTVAITPDIATVLSIVGANVTVSGVRLRIAEATLPITSTINMGTNVFDIEAPAFNTFTIGQETRLNTIKQETRVFEIA